MLLYRRTGSDLSYPEVIIAKRGKLVLPPLCLERGLCETARHTDGMQVKDSGESKGRYVMYRIRVETLPVLKRSRLPEGA